MKHLIDLMMNNHIGQKKTEPEEILEPTTKTPEKHLTAMTVERMREILPMIEPQIAEEAIPNNWLNPPPKRES